MFQETTELRVEKAHTTEQFNAIAQFYAKVGQNETLNTAVLSYEYLENPAKHGGFFFYSNNENNVVATAGFIGFDLIQNGKIQKAGMLERSLLRRSYWGTDTFAKLENDVMQSIMSSAPIKFVWSLTAPHVSEAFTRIGYKSEPCLTDLILNVSQSLPIGLPSKEHQNNITIKCQEGFNDDISELIYTESLCYPNILFMKYSPAQAEWLAEKNPFLKRSFLRFYHEKKLIAYALIKNSGNSLRIDDLLLTDLSFVPQIMQYLKKEAEKRQLESVKFYYNKHNELMQNLGKALIGYGFCETKYPAVLVYKLCELSYSLNDIYFNGVWAPPYWAPPPKKN